MTPRQNFALLCALLAAAAAVVFFAISIDHDVYAPGAGDVHFWYLITLRSMFPMFDHELREYFLFRKAYSIVAFSIVGFLVAPAVERRRRLALSSIVVGFFSALIEIGQKVTGSSESLASNAFDVACGAVGGAIGAIAWNVAASIARRRRSR